MEHTIITAHFTDFCEYLHREERSENTIQKYLHDLKRFYLWLDGRTVTKETVGLWKEFLTAQGYGPNCINGNLAALHSFFAFTGWQDCRVKYLKFQRKMFRDSSRELTKDEFCRLVATADSLGKRRLSLLLETICATGIRVSEVNYITVAAARTGRADISLKGKIRTILIPGKLCRKLQKYAKKQKITSGEIFRTASGKSLSRRQIWGEMKQICKAAGVEATKVFPHNLRHLFARTFYKAGKDIVKLADVLGHSSIETTRIYLISTGEEHVRYLNRLNLIL